MSELESTRHAHHAVHPDGESCGTVFKKNLGHYTVNAGGRIVLCTISNRLRKNLVYPIADPNSIRPHVMAVKDIWAVDPVAIGDTVRFVDGGAGEGMITEVLPRTSKLVRRAAGTKTLEQVIVANVDQIVAVFAAAQPASKWELLDRYLAAAEAADLPAIICITKQDLIEGDHVLEEVETYRKIGYPVLLSSAITGEGLEAVRQALAGRVSVLAGSSGAGKTSLLNALEPGLGLRVSEVSRHTGKGKHTTSYLQMFELQGGGSVVDTPGMREFGLYEVDGEGLDTLFPEMRSYLGHCRFGVDCSHSHEPGCAVKQAVAAGEISPRRHRSYLRMKR